MNQTNHAWFMSSNPSIACFCCADGPDGVSTSSQDRRNQNEFVKFVGNWLNIKKCGISLGNVSRYFIILHPKFENQDLIEIWRNHSYARVLKGIKDWATPMPLEFPPSQTLRMLRAGLDKPCSHSCFRLAWPSKCRSVHQIATISMATQQITMGAAKISKGVERQGKQIFEEESYSYQFINLEQ